MRVLWRDETAVAVDKPAGLLVHRTALAAGEDDALLQLVRDHVGARVYPVHRLDRGASGVVVFGLTPADTHALAVQLEAGGAADKVYLAAVRGAPSDGELVVDHAIPRREDGPRVPALTRVRRLASVVVAPGPDGVRAQSYALVAAWPESGRFHQVRRHLKHLGHPLLGDVNYGRGEHNRFVRARFGLGRLALHAAALAFDHPRTGARVIVRAPLPADLAAAFSAMGFADVVLPDAC